MTQSKNLFAAARKVAGLNQKQQGKLCSLGEGSIVKRERDPGLYKLGELRAIGRSYDEPARAILMDAITSFFDFGD